MNRIFQKRIWLAGASLLAIVMGSGDANAIVFSGPLGTEYVIPSIGYYDFTVAGAQGGSGDGFGSGGAGAIVGGELFFSAGSTLDIVVGGAGGNGEGGDGYAGGGGGGSFVFGSRGLLFAAGGGSGAPFSAGPGAPGIGHGGHPAGPASYGGAGGADVAHPIIFGPTPPQQPAQAGSFPSGGAGACCYFGGGPAGGYGGGGGGGYNGGGGGGGAPGGGGGFGGYSYVINTARDSFGITGGNGIVNFLGPGANGYVSINFVAAPEPSTWAMTLTGFAGLGWLARLRRRKLTLT